MEQLLTQFLEHLRYERNVSEHTLRNYASDLNQFLDHLAPAHPQTRKRSPVDLARIDHITIREWLSALHTAQKKKSSVARKLAALRTFFQFAVREGLLELNPAKLVSTPRLEKRPSRMRGTPPPAHSSSLIRKPLPCALSARCFMPSAPARGLSLSHTPRC